MSPKRQLKSPSRNIPVLDDAEIARRAAVDAQLERDLDEAIRSAKDLGIVSTPLEKARISLRIYTHRQSVFRAHSFLVGNETGGLTEKLGRVPIQANRTTLSDLRQLIETTVDNNMVRRNPIYQEFLSTVFTLPNPYGYQDKELRHYRFGYFASPGDTLPTIIPVELESGLLASKALPNFLTDDLVMVARSQLRPDFSMPDPEDAAIGR
jgi:hypothetical protein